MGDSMLSQCSMTMTNRGPESLCHKRHRLYGIFLLSASITISISARKLSCLTRRVAGGGNARMLASSQFESSALNVKCTDASTRAATASHLWTTYTRSRPPNTDSSGFNRPPSSAAAPMSDRAVTPQHRLSAAMVNQSPRGISASVAIVPIAATAATACQGRTCIWPSLSPEGLSWRESSVCQTLQAHATRRQTDGETADLL